MINSEVQRIHENAERDNFYGKIEVSYENGRPVIIRRTETIKPESYRNTRSLEYEVESAAHQS